jgi:hypothetical protein
MPKNPERQTLRRAVEWLMSVLGLGKPSVLDFDRAEGGLDAFVKHPRAIFKLEWKSVGDALRVGAAIRDMAAPRGKSKRGHIPVLAVPFMGDVGRRLCEEANLSWIDLSGNASIDGPGIRIRILGNPNRYRHTTKPTNLFAPRNSRLTRALLMDPKRAWTQADLATKSGLDKGRVSKLVRQMVDEGHLVKAGDGYGCRDPGTLLEAWREVYDFSRHTVTRGVLGARSSDEALQKVTKALARTKTGYAVTGLAGAWELTHHAMFRVVTVLLREAPAASLLDDLGLIEEPRGANVWLVTPNDDAVFQGMRTQDGIPCAHPLQVYLDLKAHAERADEAAVEVRRRYFDWK